MDLFGDLPPPAPSKTAVPDLFGDLPAAASTANSSTAEKRTVDEGDASLAAAKKKPSVALPKLRGFIGHRRGEREEMQDAYRIEDVFLSHFSTKPVWVTHLSYYAVFDGHAGPRAAQYAAEHLHCHVAAKFPKGETSSPEREIKKCLVDSVRVTDEGFLREATAATPSWKDGSTAVAVLVVDDTVYVSNLGDSKALLCRMNSSGEVTVVPLTKDHSPSQYEERQRIQKAGGSVRDGRVVGVLEVSRSIGDGRFKRLGVSNLADIRRCTLTTNDKFILIACDGLFKAFGIEEALKRANELLEDQTLDIRRPADEIMDGAKADETKARCEAVCARLAIEAVKRGCNDNVTAMLVLISHDSSQDSAS